MLKEILEAIKIKVGDEIDFSTDEGEWYGTITALGKNNDVFISLPPDLESDWKTFVKREQVIKRYEINKVL